MVNPRPRSTHKTPHKSSTKTPPDTGWSSSFADVSPYANGADDSDTEIEPHDGYKYLDLSKRDDQAQFTKTPFTITKSQASSRSRSSKTAREAQELTTASRNLSSSSGTTLVEPKKTLEEIRAEKEAADRNGGRSITPAIEPPKAKKEDKGNSWSNKGTSGWRNAHGQPVAASKPPNPSKVLSVLNKIDKKVTKTVKKRKAPDTATATASASTSMLAPAPPSAPAPPPKAPPKSIREQLDDIDRETKTKTKTALSVNERNKVPAAQEVERPIAGRGKGKEKKTMRNKDGDISFKMLPAGAAPNDHFPIVKGLEKMKSLPQKRKPAPHPSSSSSSSEIHVPTLDLDQLLAEADAKSEEWRPSNRVSRDAPNKTDMMPREEMQVEEHIDGAIRPTVEARRKTTKSSYFDDSMDMDMDIDLSEEQKLPSLDQSNPTELTDIYLTPHGTEQHRDDYGSIGNPSTITHLSETIPHYTDPQSSSSQVPYSSPALERARRAVPDRITMISPRPVRAVTGDVHKLERMAREGHLGERDNKFGGLLKLGGALNRDRGQETKTGGMKMERLDERDIRLEGRTSMGRLGGGVGDERDIKIGKPGAGGLGSRSNAPRSSGVRPPLPIIKQDRPDRFPEYNEDDIKPAENRWVEDEWSTLGRPRSKPARSGQPDRAQRHLPPVTPNYKVPLFRQQQGTVVPAANTRTGSSSSISKFIFRPPPSVQSSDENGPDGYRLKVVPNGTRPIPSYPMEEMTWTGAQMKRASATAKEDQRRQDTWTKETQREMERKVGAGRDGQGREQEQGDWRDEWKAQSKRQVEENPHRQYAFDAKRLSGLGVGLGRGGRRPFL